MKKHFKKLLLMALMSVMAVGLIACGTDKSHNESTKEEKTSVTITSLDASKNEIELGVPYNPKRIAILDLACLDIIDELGVGDRVVGMASTSIDYLEKYSNDASILAPKSDISESILSSIPNIEAIVFAFLDTLFTSPSLVSVARYTTGAISLKAS